MIFNLSEVLLQENRSSRVQLAKVGTFIHEEYGEFTISAYDLQRMKELFEKNVRRQMMEGKTVLPFDYRHATTEEAAGWIDSLTIENDSKGVLSLFGSVEWTPRAAQKIRDKEFKFVSPDIRRNYRDRETGEVFDVVLMGAALTNVPFLRDMEAVYLLSEDKQKLYMSKKSGDESDASLNFNQGVNMKIEEILAALGKMSPDDKLKLSEGLAEALGLKTAETVEKMADQLKLAESELEKFKKQVDESGQDESELTKRLKLSEEKSEKLGEQVKSLIQSLAKADREKEFEQMLSESKVCEAQREAYLKQDFQAFIAKSEPIKLSESGSNSSEGLGFDVQDKIEQLAEKKMEEDKNLEFGEAVSMVLSENPKLAKEYNQG